jgi:hypothetical protein
MTFHPILRTTSTMLTFSSPTSTDRLLVEWPKICVSTSYFPGNSAGISKFPRALSETDVL